MILRSFCPPNLYALHFMLLPHDSDKDVRLCAFHLISIASGRRAQQSPTDQLMSVYLVTFHSNVIITTFTFSSYRGIWYIFLLFLFWCHQIKVYRNTLSYEPKPAPCCICHLQKMNFIEEKYLDSHFTQIWYLRSKWQVSIDSANGLAPNKRLAITHHNLTW